MNREKLIELVWLLKGYYDTTKSWQKDKNLHIEKTIEEIETYIKILESR